MRLGRWKLFAGGLAALLFLMGSAPAVQAQGTVTGRVTAVGTNEPLSGSRVMLVGSNLATESGADGHYTLRGVPAGPAQVRVIRVGYQEQKMPITVVAGQTVTLDFTMTQAVVQLSEIVTTATGQQRRVELGNAVSTLGDVTQKVETTPVNSLADLMVAKSPGVTVLPGAMTGAAPVVHIRGIASLATNGSGISNNPIYVIDGVRANSGTISLGTGGTSASFLNDLDPNDIEDVEIVKGPSAATLYGTDAANGVIVITTKKGRAGATRWTWYGEGGNVDDRNKYPTDYALWGHNATSGALQRCTLVTESLGSCARRQPDLVQRDDEPGHDVHSHGQPQRLRRSGQRRVGPGALLRERRLPAGNRRAPDAAVRAGHPRRFDGDADARRVAAPRSVPDVRRAHEPEREPESEVRPYDVGRVLEHEPAAAAGGQQYVQLHLQRAQQPGLQPQRPGVQ